MSLCLSCNLCYLYNKIVCRFVVLFRLHVTVLSHFVLDLSVGEKNGWKKVAQGSFFLLKRKTPLEVFAYPH